MSAVPAATQTHRIDKPTGIGWALWPLLAALPWLLPIHADPWTTFYGEALMAVAMIPIAVWTLRSAPIRWRVDVLVAGILAASCVPFLQAWAGQFAFVADALLVSLYLIGIALTLLCARQAEEQAPLRLADALFASLVVAALLSTGAALCQWVGVDAYAPFVAPPRVDGRAIANVGQPNNLSTLLIWGVVALWWAHSRERIGGAVAVAAAAFLLVGVAVTQSRTGWVALGLVAAAAIYGRRLGENGPRPGIVLALSLWFVLLVFLLDIVSTSRFLALTTPLPLSERLTPGGRPMLWQLILDEIVHKPWTGYGWNQTMQAQVALASEHPQLNSAVQHGHNLILDLVLWNGIPLGILLSVGLVWWFSRQLNSIATESQLLLVLAIAVFGAHAMLELPHVYLFFLLPLAVMMGTLSAMRPAPTAMFAPRSVVALAVLVQAACLIVIVDDYRRVEAGILAQRFKAARIHERTPTGAPEVRVLTGLQGALDALSAQPTRGMETVVLDRARRTLERYPGPSALVRYAQASGLNGRPEEAVWALGLLCDLYSPEECEAARTKWRAAADEAPELGTIPVRLHKSPAAQRGD